MPGQIAKREIETAVPTLSTPVESRISKTKQSLGPWNVVMVEIESNGVTEKFTAFSELGIAVENVAREAVREARDYLISGAMVEEHLMDQLLLSFALAGEGSFTASECNQHTTTNIEVIQRFLAVRFATEKCEGRAACASGSV